MAGLPASFAFQKRLACSILNCGKDKVKLNPLRLKEVATAKNSTDIFLIIRIITDHAISGAQVRTLLETGAIRRVSKNERWPAKLWHPAPVVNLFSRVYFMIGFFILYYL